MASILKVDTVTGVTTAGSIAITGEGNSTTTNLQQGLAKAFISMPADQASISKSFNVSSLDDDGTGDAGINITNAFSDANHAVSAGITYDSSTNDSLRHVYVSTQTSSTIETESGYSNSTTNFTFFDVAKVYTSHGDLA